MFIQVHCYRGHETVYDTFIIADICPDDFVFMSINDRLSCPLTCSASICPAGGVRELDEY